MEIFSSVTINMASARKKYDEKNLKTLRELLSHPGNKHCFDCNQRGPTYVNVTIGSFVCTTCSGMLRGLTPPHRVKSITMATFTQEEIDFISARGNEFCKKVWLGLCDGHNVPSIGHALGGKDDQTLKDYMVSVYERKRYYVNPNQIDNMNGSSREVKPQPSFKLPYQTVQTTPTAFTPLSANNNNTNLRNSKNNNSIAAPALSRPKDPSINADPFVSLGFISPDNASSQTVDNFANFDNNPVFVNSSSDPNQQDVVDVRLSTLSDLSGIDFNSRGSNYQLQEVYSSPCRNSSSCWSSPGWNTSSSSSFQSLSSTFSCKMNTFDKVPPPPSEDRYAALKDLDSQMKSQLASSEPPPRAAPQPADWGQSTWTPNFDEAPRMPENNFFEKPSNPFSSTTENGWAGGSSFGGNPFKTEIIWPTSNGIVSNNVPVSQSQNFNQTQSPWDYSQTPNPFLVNGSGHGPNHHSSNPFL